jgi:hypothetical protein
MTPDALPIRAESLFRCGPRQVRSKSRNGATLSFETNLRTELDPRFETPFAKNSAGALR